MSKQKDNDVKAARARVSNQFGEMLSSKASEEFCLTYGRPDSPFAGLEVVSTAVRPAPIVLEFTPQPDVFAAVVQAFAQLRNSPVWTSMNQALMNIQIPQNLMTGIVTEVMEAGRSEPEILPVKAAQLLRHAEISSIRDNFMKVAGPITDEIERRFPALRGFAAEVVGGALSPGSVTQICWLNRTARARVDPRALAEVVMDESIGRIDVPRRLEPELNVSAQTVGAPQFRQQFQFSGKGIIVAVIDSEVALSHPALKGRVVHKQNYTQELWGNAGSHGTAVAGIVAANDASFSGMAPEATIYNYKVIADNPSLGGDDFDGALAIQQALEDGAHVANCSWGAGPAGAGTSREAKACNAAWALGLVIVKSAGNRGPGASTLTTPADADGIIVVGATDRGGTIMQQYSSRGPSQVGPRPHLVAPGGDAQGAGITSCLTGGGFGDCGVGTSFAAPHVSGLVALLLDQDPSLTPNDCRRHLIGKSTPLANHGVNTQGQGLVKL